jgi:hypothetical protein
MFRRRLVEGCGRQRGTPSCPTPPGVSYLHRAGTGPAGNRWSVRYAAPRDKTVKMLDACTFDSERENLRTV